MLGITLTYLVIQAEGVETSKCLNVENVPAITKNFSFLGGQLIRVQNSEVLEVTSSFFLVVENVTAS